MAAHYIETWQICKVHMNKQTNIYLPTYIACYTQAIR